MRTTIFLTTLYLVFGFFACKKDDDRQRANDIDWTNRIPALYDHNERKITIAQGVAGTTTMKQGNCMPVIDENSSCREYPVQRTVRIYDLTNNNQAQQDNEGFYTRVNTRLVTTVRTDREGYFQARIDPGTYSLFIEEGGKLYARSASPVGINTVTVPRGKTVIANQLIDRAVY